MAVVQPDRDVSSAEHWDRSWQGAFYSRSNVAGWKACAYRAAYIQSILEKHSTAPRRFLDLGCGDGTVIKHLLEMFPTASAFLVDWSQAALERARKNIGSNNRRVRFVLANSNHVREYEQLEADVVLSMGVIEHFRRPGAIVEDIAQVLPVNGVLVLMTPNRRSFVRVSRLVLQVIGRWTIGFQREYTVAELSDYCKRSGLTVFHEQAVLRRYITEDTRLTKACALADRVLSRWFHTWGWYAFVYASKQDSAP